MTLLKAVSTTGGMFNQTLFLGTAALLNSSHPDVDAGASVAEVKEVMQDAFAGDITFQEAKNYFAYLISLEDIDGCPLN